MIKVNLPKLDCGKEIFSLRLYKDTLARLEALSEKTAIRKQDLIRIAINNLLDDN